MINLIYSDEVTQYDFGVNHPFRGFRFKAFFEYLRSKLKEGEDYRILRAEPVTDEDLLLICTEEYINYVKTFYRLAYFGELNPFAMLSTDFLSFDNIPSENPGNIEFGARYIVGQMKKACQIVFEQSLNRVFSIGGGLHHGKPSFGEGFCVYNDIAFGAKYLIERYGLKRILILDTDAHGGNGTMEYFYEDPRVLFIDIHQDPRTVYPGTGFTWQIGEGDGKGFTVNCPLKPGSTWDCYEYIFENIVFPLAEEFKPEIIIRYGGTDPYFKDSLTNLGLTVGDFKKLGSLVRKLSEFSGGRLIDAIASGYNEKAIPLGWLAIISGVEGMDIEIEEPYPVSELRLSDEFIHSTKELCKELKGYLGQYWKCMR